MVKHLLITCFALFLFSSASFASLANPASFSVDQGDGLELEVIAHGDEFFHYFTTSDAYLIAKNASGYFEYAKCVGEEIITLGVLAKNKNLRASTDEQYLNVFEPEDTPRIVSLRRDEFLTTTRSAVSVKGEVKYPVILISFSDNDFITSEAQQSFSTMFEGDENPPSLKKYFTETTFNQFIPDYDVYGPYTLPQTQAYYGADGVTGYGTGDLNPQQMFIDACTVADGDIDFSNYSTDDAEVNAVILVFAGHNQAEAPTLTNTVWPHKWQLQDKTNVYDGVAISNYVCSSELRGDATSTDRANIGTFAHEFSHYLGLADFYPSDGSHDYFTMGYWDLMVYGNYSFDGLLPPLWSAYERFYCDYLTPIQLKSPQEVTITPLDDTNVAYLISSTDADHNLDGKNPVPAEFFLLENRRDDRRFDYSLPYHGMLVTHVNFNEQNWNYNTVNDDQYHLGACIVSAGGSTDYIGSSMDAFPGSSDVTSYSPTLNDETVLNKPISNIREVDEDILFQYMTVTSTADATSDLGYYLQDGFVYVLQAQSLSLYSLSGKCLTANFEEEYARLNVSAYPSGLYLLKVQMKDQVQIIKLEI